MNIVIDNEVSVDEDFCAEHMNIDHQVMKETKTGLQRKLKLPMNKQEMMTVDKSQIQSICTFFCYLCYCHYHLDSLFTHPLFSPQSP